MSARYLDLRTIAHALGGEISGGQVLAPGPGHSRKDRSLAVRLSHQSPSGFVVHGFAPGDDWRTCRDYVADRLGLGDWAPTPRHPSGSPASEATRIERATSLWNGGRNPAGTVVEQYLASRGLKLPALAVSVLRYHPQCPWKETTSGITIRVPAMLAAMRSLDTGQITAVHRTRLTQDGQKVDRRMIGVAARAAIHLEDLAGSELVIGEGIETCLAGAQLGLRPVWAVASAGAIGAFPVLRGVDKLTILAERDSASETAVTACHGHWTDAGPQGRDRDAERRQGHERCSEGRRPCLITRTSPSPFTKPPCPRSRRHLSSGAIQDDAAQGLGLRADITSASLSRSRWRRAASASRASCWSRPSPW